MSVIKSNTPGVINRIILLMWERERANLYPRPDPFQLRRAQESSTLQSIPANETTIQFQPKWDRLADVFTTTIFIKFTNHDFFSFKLNRLDVLRSSATCVFGLKCKINCIVLTFSWQHPVRRWMCGSSFAINWCNITGLTYCNTYCEQVIPPPGY